jgi:hypothetical protein
MSRQNPFHNPPFAIIAPYDDPDLRLLGSPKVTHYPAPRFSLNTALSTRQLF